MQAKIKVTAVVVFVVGALLWSRWPADSGVRAVQPGAAVATPAVEPSQVESPTGADHDFGRHAPEQAPVEPDATQLSPVLAPTPTVQVPGLKGRVLDLAGDPVAGVPIVQAPFGTSRAERESLVAVESDALGWFTLEAPAEWRQIDAIGPHWCTVLEPRILDLAKARREAPIVVVAPAITLAGGVSNVEGRGIPRATLEVALPQNLRFGSGEITDESHTLDWSVRTDLDGSFELEGAPGVEGATITIRAPGFDHLALPAPQVSDWTLEIVLTGDGAVELLVGRVVDPEGRGVPRAWVVLGRATARADDEGRFELNPSDAGDARVLRAAAEGWLPAELEGRAGGSLRDAWPTPLEIELSERPGVIDGVVFNARGEPAAEVAIGVRGTTEFAALPWIDGYDDRIAASVESVALGGSLPSARTDAQGRFELAGLAAREYVVTAYDEARAVGAESEPVSPGTSVELHLPQPPRLVRAAGRVLGLNGDAIAGVSVRFVLEEADGSERSWGVSTDEDGGFEHAAVPVLVTHVVVSGDPVAEEHIEALAPDQAWTQLELRVPRYCHLQVDARGLPAASSFAVHDAAGEPVLLRSKHGWVETGAWERGFVDGVSEMHRMSELGVTLIVYQESEEGAELLRQPIALDPEEPLRIRL